MLQGEVQSTSTLNNWVRYINKIIRQDLTRVNHILQSEVQSTSTLNDWARYVDKINRQDLTGVNYGNY